LERQTPDLQQQVMSYQRPAEMGPEADIASKDACTSSGACRRNRQQLSRVT